MAKKKSPPQKAKEPEPKPAPKPEPVQEAAEEDVTCPVCGKVVGIEVTECPHCGAAFEEEEIEEVIEQPTPVAKPAQKAVVEEPLEPVSEDDMAACPVCGKMVSLSVSACPNCGAEFEEEEVEEVIAPAAAPPKPEPKAVVEEPLEAEAVSEDEMAECPVCGKLVSLNVSACPNCGAEFEEEEVEEVIEVEERASKAPARPEPAEVEEVPMVVEGEEAGTGIAELEGPTSILDLRVIGVALIILGIIGSQISFMIDWYWTWVPPIENNFAMFIALPAVVIVVGLLVYLLVKRAAGNGRKLPKQTPGMSLSLFLFGILALVLVMLWNPINDALQNSSGVVGAVFVIMLVAGIAMYFIKIRSESGATA